MALLPLLQWRCHPLQGGVVALGKMALSSSSIRRCPFHHCNGIVALVVMALLPLMCRHLHRCQVIVIALIACRKAGIVALVVMALLPLMRGRLHRCCDGD